MVLFTGNGGIIGVPFKRDPSYIHKSKWAKILWHKHPEVTEDCKECAETATHFHATLARPRIWELRQDPTIPMPYHY